MTIKKKLVLNAVVVIAAMVIIIATSIIGTQFIKGKVNELTQKTTPYQLKALNLQRTLQAHTTNLVGVSTSSKAEDCKRMSTGVAESLVQVTTACDEMAALKGAPSDIGMIKDITKEILEKSQAKIAANEAARSAADGIKQRLAEASKKMSDLDASIRKLQQNTSSAMVGGVDNLIAANRQVNNLTAVRDGLKDIGFYISKIPGTTDKRSVASLRDNTAGTIKKIVQTLKDTKGMDKTVQEIIARLNILSEKVTAAKGLAYQQLQYISEEDEGLKPRIESAAKEDYYEITYMMPSIEKEINNANAALKTSTGGVSRNIGAFGDTNSVLSYSSSLSLIGASLETRIIQAVGRTTMDDFTASYAQVGSAFSQGDDAAAKLRGLLAGGNYTGELNTLKAYTTALSAVKREFSGPGGVAEKVRASIKNSEELEKLNGRMREMVSRQLLESNKEVSTAGENQEKAIVSVNTAANSTIATIGGAGGISVILALLMGGWIGRTITNPLKETCDIVLDISKGEGDLTKRLIVRNDDEVGTVCKGFNELVDKLHSNISVVAEKVDTVVSSANELSATAEQLSGRAREQSQQTEGLAAAAEELSAVVLDVAKNAQASAESALETKQVAVMGEEVVRSAIEGIKTVEVSINDISSSITDLSGASAKIGEVANVIKDIAEQTNLLALNAAIEAARAGEQGRGFAVVADSVRQLAERTAKATAEITDMIKSIQEGTNKSSGAMVKGIEDVNKVVDKANKAEAALHEIVEKVDKQAELIRHMATAANQQSTTVDSMVSNITTVAGASKEFASGTDQISQTAEDLDRVAVELQKVVKQFKL